MDEQDPPGVSQLEASCPFSNLQLDAEKTSPNPVQVGRQGFFEGHNLETGHQQMETLNEENAFIKDDDCNQLGADFSGAFLPAMSRETKVSQHNANAMVGYRVSEIEDDVIVSGESRVSEQECAVMETGVTRVSEQDSNVMVAGVIRVSKQEDTLRVSGVLASERTRVLQQEATAVLSGGYRVSQNEADVMIPGAIRVSGPETIAMEPRGSRVLGQEGVLCLSLPTGGGEHFTVEDISGEDLDKGGVDAFSALEGVEFEYDTEYAAQFDMDTLEEEPVTGTFSGEHCRFPARDADRMASSQASQEVSIIERSFVQCHVDLNEGIDSKSTPMEPITGTILDSATVHGTDVAPKCVQNEHMQAGFESASTDGVQRVEELSGIQGALLQAQTQNKEALADCVQEDKNLAGDQDIEADVENAQGPPGCDGFMKLTDGEDRRASAPEIYLQCASDTDEVFLSLYGEEVEISQTSQSCESRNSHDIASTHQMGGAPIMAVEEVENGTGHLRTTSQAAAVKIFPHEQELSRSYPDSGAGPASAPNTTSDKEGMHVHDVHSLPVFIAETGRAHEEDARQSELNIQGSRASGECGPVVIGPEEVQFTDLHSVVVGAAEQTVEAENDEKGHIESSGIVHTDNESLNAVVEAGIFECVRVPVDDVQDQNISVGVSKDFSMSTEEPASQFLGQKEEITIIQSEHAVTCMEADETATEQVEKHIDDPMLMGENVVEEFNGIVSDADQLNGDEFLKEKPSNPEQGKLLSSEHQEEHSPKNLLNSCPTQAGVDEQGEKPEILLKNSPSDPGTFVPWRPESLSLLDDNIQEQHTSEDVSGDKYVDFEKPAPYMVVQPKERTDKHSEREEHGVSSTEASISPTKHSEKQVDDHMFAKSVGMFDGGIVEAKQSDKIYEENVGEWFSADPEEEHSAKKLQKACKGGHAFGIGDLVWAKVRSHPWWPAQIFDPVDASVSAKKIERSGRALVGFFGDCTFGWLQQSQMIAFRPYFKEKVKQTTMKSFCKAVTEALEEFCRRSELGLNCPHYKGFLHSSSMFPDANAGIQKGVRIINHKDISASVEMFKPDKALEFVKGVACSPFGSWNSTLEVSELRGHAYGLRTCMVASKNSNAGNLLQNIQVERAVSADVSKPKRRFSSLETNDEAVAEEGKEAKKVDMGKKRRASEGKGLSLTPRRLKTPVSKENDHTEAVGSVVESDQVARNAAESGKGKRDCLSKGFQVSKKVKRDHLSCLEAFSDAAVGKEVEGEKSLDDGTETLFALAGYHPKVLKRSGKGSLRDDENSGFIKKKVRRKSAWDAQDAKSISDSERADEVSFKAAAKGHHKRASDSDLAASTITETKTKDAFSFMPSDSDEKSFDADDEVLKSKKKSLNNKKSPVPLLDLKKVQVRTVEGKQQFNSLRLESRDGLNRASKVTKPREGEVVKGDMQSSSDTSKKGDVRKLNKAVKLGDSIRKVAGELTATPPLTMCADEFSAGKSRNLGSSKETKGLASDPPLPKYKKAVCKVSAEERSPFSPVQLRHGLELLARDPLNSKPSGRVTEDLLEFRTKVFKKSSGYDTDAAPFSGERLRKAVKHAKKGDQAGHAKAEAITSPPCWQIVGCRSQRPGVQELALAARKRKSEIVQEGVTKTPKKSPTSGPHGHHSSKVIISVEKPAEPRLEKPAEPRLFEKNIIKYSRRPVPPASNVMCYSQIYDEKLSSQLPLGLFMRFPEDFALPSESQLKATFVRFGPLQTSGTRLYKDSTSAQVVFKHGRDAEFALKHAKKNAMFGQAAVTYKLRHLSHSSRADTKKDTLSSARSNSSSRVDGRLSISSKERIERNPAVANASSQNRVEQGGTGTSEAMQIPSNDNMATNFGSEPTGDIQDKMMTLLRQVSVIVGTSPVPSDTA